jgi:zinc D-Ala-D-Ala carboxypeptidase
MGLQQLSSLTFPSAFPLSKLIHSDTAVKLKLDNTPNAAHTANLHQLALALQAVERLLGHPLAISSGYRSPAVNAAVGGVPNSAHAAGLAADFTCAAFGSPVQVARAIAASDLPFDQLIHEYRKWVHLAIAPLGKPARRERLTILSAKVGYVDGLVD